MGVSDTLGRVGTVAYAAWEGSLVGRRGIGLMIVAGIYPLLVLAIASAHRSNIDLVSASEQLYSVLFLPLLLLIVCLVMGISLLRGEIEDDTIVYPVMRSLPRPALVVGKYIGFVVAALIFLLPAALLGLDLSIALNVGSQVPLGGVTETFVVTTVLAVLAYGAFFLLLGLLTRDALVIGLIYGFFWETFVPLLPGPFKELTMVYYIRSIGGQLSAGGPLSQVPNLVSLPAAVGVPVGFAVATVIACCLAIREIELGAAPGPA